MLVLRKFFYSCQIADCCTPSSTVPISVPTSPKLQPKTLIEQSTSETNLGEAITGPKCNNKKALKTEVEYEEESFIREVYAVNARNELHVLNISNMLQYQKTSNEQIANEEPTNGLKIMRKKDPIVDLTEELDVLSNTNVVQRLKLLIDRLENGFPEDLTSDVLRKNLQYAINLIQDGGIRSDSSHSLLSSNDQFNCYSTSTCIRNRVTFTPLLTKIDSVDELINDTFVNVDEQMKKNDQELSPTKVQDILRIPDESDHELSEVEEEVIPEEVKAWLASTFTKNFPPRTKALEPRPRFRSVANAIRVGLFVDRFYRQLSSNTLQIPQEVATCLKDISNWQFDIFKLHEKSNNHSLKYVAKDLFTRYGIIQKFKINMAAFECFISAVEHGYSKLRNPYHNDIHAADVTQSLHYMIGSSNVVNVLTDLEIFALLFAAIIHDFEHTGRTNNFHINVGTDLALLYNDRAVLENHHVSAAFKLMKDDDKNIIARMKPDDYREFRTLVIEMVLSTDMSSHFTQLKTVRSMLKDGRNGVTPNSTVKTTTTAMCLFLHCADISHPGKPWKIHKKLADHILEEFFLQGDEESKLGLPFSPLCDRASVLIPESQISFIEYIVEPSLTVLGELIDFMTKEDNTEVTLASLKQDPSQSHHQQKIKSLKHGRRAESDTIMSTSTGINTTLRCSSASIKPELKTLNDGGRTSSFPIQFDHSRHGTISRPWINHLQENKAKWKMIAAEHEAK